MRATMLVCVFFFALMSASVAAEQITYNFTVVATDGPLAGTTSNGSFAYDSNGPTGLLAGVLTALSFTWHGITYGPTNANSGWLFTGIDSGVTSIDFGTNCKAGSCEVLSGTDEWSLSNDLGL